MVTAISVAKYILNERARRGHSTAAFALQKLLYLCKGLVSCRKRRCSLCGCHECMGPRPCHRERLAILQRE